MASRLLFNPVSLPLMRLIEPASAVSQVLEQGGGVRLGQSAVLSTKVHAFNSHSPEHVQVMANADAGQVFYRRLDCGAIYHLDTFHQCGCVDHRAAAEYVCQAVAFYHKLRAAQADAPCTVSPDLIDIQTASGGGRITGLLTGGQKLSICRVHQNHVHLALYLPPEHVACLFYIVAAVETAILEAGLELRCNERISCIDSTDSQASLSPYTDHSDSLLTGESTNEQVFETANQSTAGSSSREASVVLAPDNSPPSAGGILYVFTEYEKQGMRG